MSDKQLKEKAIKIKGKDYVMVKDRVSFFNETYENGCIVTNYELVGDSFLFCASVFPDLTNDQRYFTGHAQEIIGDGNINKTSAMENAETSAVGRALAFMGIGVIDSIASIDEINKAKNRTATPKEDTPTDYFVELTNFCNKSGVKVSLGEVRNVLSESGIKTDAQLKKFTAPKALEVIKNTLNKGE